MGLEPSTLSRIWVEIKKNNMKQAGPLKLCQIEVSIQD